MARLFHIFLVAVFAFSFLDCSISASAQTFELPRYSVGTFHSAKGFGLSGDIFRKGSDHISSVAVFLDMQSILNGASSSPGIRFRYNYNLPLLARELANGDNLLVFCGPGITFGYVRDTNTRIGYMCGISGDIVCSFLFKNNLSLSLALEASVAFHLREDNNTGVMDFKFYQAGLFNAYMPELRLQYNW